MTAAAADRTSIKDRLYDLIIAPKQHDQQLRNREVVCNIALLGTVLVMGAFFILLAVSFSALHNTYVLGRLAVCVGAFIYLCGVFWLSRSRRYLLSAHLLVLFYLILAMGTVWQWGTSTTFGILTFGLVIVLAGTLLSSRHVLYTAGIAIITTLALHAGAYLHLYSEHFDQVHRSASFGDAMGYNVQFAIIALVSWLFGREVERSLGRAQHAETALLEEKAMLEIRVKERTLALRKAQIEEMQQMYQFAEVGQLSTALLHDLANYLTVLTMEIEGIHGKQHADAISRTQHIIKHLDKMIDGVRERMKGKVQPTTFSMAAKMNEVVDLMRYRAAKAKVSIDWRPPADPAAFNYKGDVLRFNQVVTILITNAIDAYASSKTPPQKRRVMIVMEQRSGHIQIRVTDWGSGITERHRDELFKPFQSTKQSGMGIGLYLAKQMIEMHFSGTIELADTADYTEFIVDLPENRP